MQKIYIDSRCKTPDSKSNTNFRFELNTALEIKDEKNLGITDIIIPNSWYSIEDNNNNLYVRVVSNGLTTDRKIKIDQRNYNAIDLRNQLQTKINTAFSQVSNLFSCTYNASTGSIKIEALQDEFDFYIFTDEDLKTLSDWSNLYYDKNNPRSLNNVLANSGRSKIYNLSNPFNSGFIDLVNTHSLYLHCNLTGLDCVGPDGNYSNIIKKICVSGGFGFLIIDNVFNEFDYTIINRGFVKNIEFQLTDVYGNVMDLHGSHISFTLILKD